MISDKGITIKRATGAKDHLTFHDGDVPYFSIPLFDELGVKNGFSTKFGGVSHGFYAEMNLGMLKEPEEIGRENYRRMLRTLHMSEKRPVLSWQTHTTNIRRVTDQDAGKGPFRARDYRDVDGLVTDLKDTPLVTLFADCVPLYFYDPVNQAIGLSHAGWRGTVGRMAEKTIQRMHLEFNTAAPDVYAAVGPSICGECYEVGAEVAEQFIEEFGRYRSERFLREKPDGKYLLDLWRANESVLLSAGVPKEHIFITDICTKCNPDLLFSHRVTGEKRGVMGAFLSL